MNQLRATSSQLGDDSCDRIDRQRQRSIGPHRVSSLATRNPQPATRRAVTLIELLITITIIATLSTIFLGVSRAAMESARAARTKTLISRIHGLVMERWTSYATRRVDIHPQVLSDLEISVRDNVAPNLQRRALGEARADLRLLAVRELMKLEMPDRWSDLIGNSVSNVLPTAPVGDFLQPKVLASRPALTTSYLRRYVGLKNRTDVDVIQGNQAAECLYLIVMLGTADGEARSLFSDQDIGDTDGDGALEFLDGWGRPIQFIRWPAGYVSDLIPFDTDANRRFVDQDHDPFDSFRRDQRSVSLTRMLPRALPPGLYPATAQNSGPNNGIRDAIAAMAGRDGAYRLVPLIYSRGPDGATDMVLDTGELIGLDPYALSSISNVQLATVLDTNDDGDDNSLDNIHNHLQDNR